MGGIAIYLEREEKDLLRQARELEQTLTRLKYEGKVFRARNVKAANAATSRLIAMVQKHRRLQERVVFPFLQAHIPKYENMIRFLRSDYVVLEKNKQNLLAELRKISKSSKPGLKDLRIQELGACLICFLRHHVDLEEKKIHNAIKLELRPDEKREISRKIRQWEIP